MVRSGSRPSGVRLARRGAALMATLVLALAGCTTRTDAADGGSSSALSPRLM